MRKLRAFLALGLLALALSGCAGRRTTIFSFSYWGRHIVNLSEEFHEFRVDLDRTIFDIEDIPVEEM